MIEAVSNKPRWWRQLVWLVWWVDVVLIVIGSVISPLQHHAPWESSGVSHFVAYMGLGLLPMLLRPGLWWVVVLFFGATAFGALMEWIQTFQPERYGTVSDVLINAAGVACGIVVGWLAERVTAPLLRRMGTRG